MCVCVSQCFTFELSVKVRVGGHLEAGVRQQEAADVGEAGVDVFPDVLQLLMLVLLHLNTTSTFIPSVKSQQSHQSFATFLS